jgi:predicted transposase YbfD/YdcC
MNILSYFSEVSDPRVDRTKFHKLEDIIFIAIASVLCGAETWNDMEDYGNQKTDWLKTIIELPNGVPSHDTFNRFFASIEPEEFERCFSNWTNDISIKTDGEIVSIDGKTMRGSRKSDVNSAIHIVSAWSDKNQLILGQVKVDDKSNEITAIPELLNSLMLTGTIVTIDAMGCQKNIAKKIIDKNADYILSVKENQKDLFDDILDSFRVLSHSSFNEEIDYGHGRIETRKCFVISDLSLIEDHKKWKGLKSIIKVERCRHFKATAKEEFETSFYISSLDNSEIINNGIRSHWGIENKVHWILDVAFNEDHSRKRNKFAAQNYTCLNRIALNILINDKTVKRGIKGKRLNAAWNNQYLLKLLKKI